jgi:hypothetical protein
VCSACSGDYDGDFEEPAQPEADSGDGDHAAWTCGDPEAGGNWLGTEGAGSFESALDSESNSHPASLPRSKPENTGDICEILVSATRIVEIRIVTANSEGIRELRDAGTPETLAASKHAKAASAKYYKTRGSVAEGASDRPQLPCCREVTVSVAREFKRWGRWARKALRKSRVRNF